MYVGVTLLTLGWGAVYRQPMELRVFNARSSHLPPSCPLHYEEKEMERLFGREWDAYHTGSVPRWGFRICPYTPKPDELSISSKPSRDA